MNFREITEEDIPTLFAIRVRTHENRLAHNELAALGITEDSVRTRLKGSFKGWLCEVDRQGVGFAMGDRSSGELWVIAVVPEYLGQGIGARLLERVETWLGECGWTEAWLTTDVDVTLRAYAFYRQHGWVDSQIKDGLRYMKKNLLNQG